MAARGQDGVARAGSWRLVAGVALLLVACAPATAEEPSSCTEDAMLVFDGSGSMASAGYNELEIPRIFDALDAVRRVLPRVAPHRRIGLIVYGPGARDACSNIELRLPPDFNSADSIISELEALKPNGDTPLTAAVEAAAEALDYRNRPGTIVLVTDGDETCGGVPCQLGQRLKAEGLATTVHVIGFKVRSRFFDWSLGAAPTKGETASQCLADMTGGLFVSTDTTEELVLALQRTLECPVVTQDEGEASPGASANRAPGMALADGCERD